MNTSASRKTRLLGVVVSMAISIGLVAYLIVTIDWQEVYVHLQGVNIWYVLPLLMMFIPMMWLRAWRWKFLLPNRDELSIPRLMDATIMGFFASSVLPLRAGELVRPWILTRWQPVKFTPALASILIERLFDSICLLSLMLLCFTQVPEVPPEIITGAWILLGITGVIIGIVLISYLMPRTVEKFFHGAINLTAGHISPKLAEKLNNMVVDYFAGIRVITSVRQLVWVILLSFIMWLLVAAWYQGLIWAFGVYPTFWVGMMLNVMIALAVAAPSAPGFIGVFQFGCIAALHFVYGYSEEFAVAYSVVGHLMQMAFNIGAGLFVLHLRGVSFRSLREAS